jgi:hypothetical protein
MLSPVADGRWCSHIVLKHVVYFSTITRLSVRHGCLIPQLRWQVELKEVLMLELIPSTRHISLSILTIWNVSFRCSLCQLA